MRSMPGALAHHAYLGPYILGYLADDAVMVTLAVLALGSGLVMCALGTVLLLRPQ